MRPARVLLLTVVDTDGEVDVAIRADVAVGELVRLLGNVVGAPDLTAAGAGSPGGVAAPLVTHPEEPTAVLPVNSTLLRAGLVNGNVIELFP